MSASRCEQKNVLSYGNKENYEVPGMQNIKVILQPLQKCRLKELTAPLYFLVSIIAISVFLPHKATAGPPFLTDDPEPVGYRHGEVYLAVQYKHDVEQYSSTLPHLEINYGAVPDVQIHLIAPVMYVDAEGKSSQYGYGDTEMGIKYRFIKETGSCPQIGIFPMVEFPTGDKEKNLGNGRTQYFIPLWLQKSYGQWTTYGGGGYWINPGPGNRNWWQLGWQLSRDMNSHFTPGAELYYRTADAAGRDDALGYTIGALINLNENHHLLFSVGQDIDGPVDLSVYAGYQFTFGPIGYGSIKKSKDM